MKNIKRLSWHEYFFSLAVHASSRSTCLAANVGAVIVRDNHVLATGYNGSPSKSNHCITQGYCYKDLEKCTDSQTTPSRAIHAEINAIAQSAKHGISTQGATIYVTHEPCINCFKLIIAAGLIKVVWQKGGEENQLNQIEFIDSGIDIRMQCHATLSEPKLTLLKNILN